ncbi:MAG: tetratricopeptide repeat-containing diguanylate cyclase [Pseudomonadota bacterium]
MAMFSEDSQRAIAETKSFILSHEKGGAPTFSDAETMRFSIMQALLAIAEGDAKKSLALLKKVKPQLITICEPQYLANIFHTLAHLEMRVGDLNTAINYSTKALAYAQQANDREYQIKSLLFLGSASSKMGKLEDSLALFYRGHKLLKEDDQHIKSSIYNSIANTYTLLEDFNKAIEYYQKSLEIGPDDETHPDVYITLINIGRLYLGMDDHRSAKPYLEKALAGAEKRDDIESQASANLTLGTIYIKENLFDKAIEYLDAAVNFYESLEHSVLLARSKIRRSIVEIKTNRDVQGAMNTIKQSLPIILKNNMLVVAIEAHEELVAGFENLKDLPKVVYYLKALDKLKTQLAKDKNDKEVARLKIAFDTDYVESKNEKLEIENKLKGEAIQHQQKISQLYFVAAISLGALLFLLLVALRMLMVSRKAIRKLSLEDELTGISNRRAILMILEHEIEKSKRNSKNLSVAIIDLDFFKKVNDSLGHVMGDKVLKAFASIVENSIRSQDKIARFGGEEFILMLTETSSEQAKFQMKRIIDAVHSYAWQNLHPSLSITFSAGVAQHRLEENLEQLCQRADSALYEAKKTGRDRYCMAS